MNIKDKIRKIPDFPIKGILFWDFTTLFGDGAAFKQVIDELAKRYKNKDIDYVASIESRGFVIGSALAYALRRGFIMIRKKGKLPYKIVESEYEKEYGKDVIQMHEDAIKKGEKVLLIDDLIATGETALAACRLVEQEGGKVVECAFVVELTDFDARNNKLKDYEVFALISSKEHE